VVLRQFVDDDLGCASYLIGDERTGAAAVVDPAYAIEPYVEAAERAGLRLELVLETHTHADHLSGHGRFALEHGLSVAIHGAAEPEYPAERLADGDEVAVGEVRVRVLHTPGHRPEHCCFVVDGAVLTGDSLLVGTAARPDLAVDARDGARALFHSLRRIGKLPDDVRVLPGHVAGSLCASGMSSAHSSTIAAERLTNAAFRYDDADEFVAETANVKTPRPPTMRRVVELNRGPFLGAPEPLRPVGAAGDATVVDLRDPELFAGGHVPGAINVPLSGGSVATRAGFVLRPGERVVLRAGSSAELETGARTLRAGGILELDGYLEAPREGATLDPLELDELERLVARDAVEIVDVREADERDSAYIPGSRHLPYRLVRVCGEDLSRDRPLVTVCESGARAAVAASILSARGFEARPLLHGGIPDWQRRGLPTTSFRRCGA
jgi:glyoxylase-like metal-dependent hydrolase (beta-lactamase superfamily II)